MLGYYVMTSLSRSRARQSPSEPFIASWWQCCKALDGVRACVLVCWWWWWTHSHPLVVVAAAAAPPCRAQV